LVFAVGAVGAVGAGAGPIFAYFEQVLFHIPARSKHAWNVRVFFFELRSDMDLDDSYALFNLYNASDGEGDTPVEKPPTQPSRKTSRAANVDLRPSSQRVRTTTNRPFSTFASTPLTEGSSSQVGDVGHVGTGSTFGNLPSGIDDFDDNVLHDFPGDDFVDMPTSSTEWAHRKALLDTNWSKVRSLIVHTTISSLATPQDDIKCTKCSLHNAVLRCRNCLSTDGEYSYLCGTCDQAQHRHDHFHIRETWDHQFFDAIPPEQCFDDDGKPISIGE
jgi:hypothetical protein